MYVEELLRENFATRADRVPAPPRDLLRTTVDGYRRARRRRAAAVAGGLAVVLALGGATLGSGLLDAETPDVAVAPGYSDLGVYEVPTRGSLAGDQAFVDGVRSIEWSAPMGWEGAWLQTDEADRRVLFAGEVPGGQRWALVMGRSGFQLLYAWFTGPSDASGATLQPAGPPGRGGPDEPMSLLDPDGSASTLVVVGLPGDEVAFSPDGASWEPVPTDDDGVAIGRVTTPEFLADAEVRSSRDGGDVVHRSVPSHPQPNGFTAPTGTSAHPADDPDGTQYGVRMRACLLTNGWVVTAAAGGAAFVASPDMNAERVRAFQQDMEQCEVVLGYRD